MGYETIVIGVSSGGMNAMRIIFSQLPADFSIPIVIVQHISSRSDGEWIKFINDACKITVKEADEKEHLEPGKVYIAPPNYHLLIERDGTFSLTIDERVNYARPSIDVLFESAAVAFRNKLIGVVLTGSNNDGTKGMKRIKEYGGLTIVQDPTTAESVCMPASVIAEMKVDYVLPLKDIIKLLLRIAAR